MRVFRAVLGIPFLISGLLTWSVRGREFVDSAVPGA